MLDLEVCVDSVESAVKAVAGGADRLEVCSALALGGLTPSIGLLSAIHRQVPQVRLMAMLRPRHGDFIYSIEELEVIQKDLFALRDAGANGFCFGAMNCEGNLAIDENREIVSSAGGIPVTLHRAIDVCRDWRKAIDDAVTCGFSTILSSGQEPTAHEGAGTLKEMVQYAGERIIIMAGGGLTPVNIRSVARETGCRWLHGSASIMRAASSAFIQFPFGSADASNPIRVTDIETVRLMKNALSEL